MLDRPILVRGSALRDEFSCPITRELMQDPVIAADGHTYDREAIEMWLRNHDTSPKTGQPMDQLSLVPNLNLRRLIKDLLSEGAEGLYVHTAEEADGERGNLENGAGGRGGETGRANEEYRFALYGEENLVLKCLGPTDSDWNNKYFRVTEHGCVGGRKQPAMLDGADFMQFSDATVSRRHFGIVFDKEEKRFSLCDFGSAGGTFVRLASGVPTPLYPSMMIMLGKHQLEVTNVPADETDTIDDPDGVSVAAEDADYAARPKPSRLSDAQPGRRGIAGSGGGAGVKEGATTDQEEGGGQQERGRPTNALSGKLKAEDGVPSLRIGVTTGTDGVSPGEGVGLAPLLKGAEHRSRQDSSRSPLPHENENGAGGEDDASVLDTPLQDKHLDRGRRGGSDDEKELEGLEKSFEAGVKLARGHRRVCLECFAPEGTPIQGSRFLVGRKGATLGRRQTNTIAFSHEANGAVMGIDASISGEHARIEYDEDGDFLHITDGTASKPSTNGTWFRLSAMHKESRAYPLSNGAEILIGTVRFSVSVETLVVEKEITADNRDHFMSLAASEVEACPPWGQKRTAGGRGKPNAGRAR